MSSIEGVGGQSDIMAAAFGAKPKETEEEEFIRGDEASGVPPQKTVAPSAGQSGDETQTQTEDTGSFMEGSSIDKQV